MKLKQFTDATVKRVIPYTWETWNEKAGENESQTFDLEVWFRKNQLSISKAQELQTSLADETTMTDTVLEFLCAVIAKWNLDDPVKISTFKESVPQDLAILMVTSVSELMNGENPTQSKS